MLTAIKTKFLETLTEVGRVKDRVKFPEAILSTIFPERGKVTILGFVAPDQPVAANFEYPPPGSATTPGAISLPKSSKPELPYFDPIINGRGVSHFVGREDIIKRLHEKIQGIRDPTRVVSLQGLGGQGKTAIAVQYAHLYGSSSYKLVFWVDASTERSVGSACQRIVRERELIQGVDVITDQQAVEAVTRYLQSPEAECLILFDNFDATDSNNQQRISTILPLRARPRERVTILMTTRVTGASGYGMTLRIEGMTEDDAMELLRYRWMPDGEIPSDQREHCRKILEDVGYLPLAIEQAGAFLCQCDMNAFEYLEHIKKRRAEVREFWPPNASHRRFALISKSDQYGTRLTDSDEGEYLTAFVTWDVSMKKIGGGEDSTALKNISNPAKLMRLAAFLSRDHLPSSFFAILGKKSLDETPHFLRWLKIACSDSKGEWEPVLFKKALVSTLTGLFLLSTEPDPRDRLGFGLVTHPLVREWAQLRRPLPHIAYYFQAAIELVKCHMLPDNFDVEPDVKDTILHQLDAIMHTDQLLYDYEPPLGLAVCLGRGQLVPITFKFASFYLDYGIYKQTHDLYTRIIERNPEPASEEERHIVLEATEGLAIVELLQGNFREARQHCSAALEGYKKLPEKYDASRFRALHNLGEICGADNDFSEILSLFKESLEGSRKLYGDKDIRTLREVEAYANAHRVLGLYDDATALFEQAIEGMKAYFKSDNHPDTLGAIEGLAIVRKGQERFEEAEKNYKIALEGDLERLGENHPDTINVVEGLGDVYAAQGLAEQALEKYGRVRYAREMVVGEEHPDTTRILRKIDEVTHRNGKVDFVRDTAYYPWYRAITNGDYETHILEEQFVDVDEQVAPEVGKWEQESKTKPTGTSADHALNEESASKRSFANRFFREFELFRELHNSYWHSTAERIKVAVLDTGLDKNGTTTRGIIDEIEQNRGKRGRRWHDGPIKQTTSFVGGSGDEDTCGHGTRVAQLILRLAPQADLYVARVSKGYSDEDENAGDNIAKAILWAVEQKVDIITMSFSLTDRHAKVREAIREVPASCVLFAAASNWGGNRGRTYPATDRRVICINASDGNGNNSSGLNPPHEKYHDAWTTLGAEIGFASDSDDQPVYLSGTSYATPIAVAIAVNSIDYVENLYKRGKLSKDRRDFLVSDDGVPHMFRLMSQRMDGWDYVAPWNLWKAQHGALDMGDEEDYVYQQLARD